MSSLNYTLPALFQSIGCWQIVYLHVPKQPKDKEHNIIMFYCNGIISFGNSVELAIVSGAVQQDNTLYIIQLRL